MIDEHAMPPRAAAPARYQQLDDEAGLWQRWRNQGELAAREALIRHYLSYARALAAQMYARRSMDEFEFDEYMQFATVGLLEALDRYDPERGILFKTFATTRINGAMLSGLSTLSERQQQIAMRRRMADERVKSLQEAPLPADPERLLRELAEIGVGLALGFVLEGSGMLASAEASVADNTYTRLELRQFQQQIRYLCQRLTAREREVIEMHYLQHISFEEVAERLQLSKGRVSQLHAQGLKRLRTLLLQTSPCDVTL
ncbi:RNA polymerase sigma factor for flagellar operon FliA [Duganella sacchari]|uniref:RNA polymerase sigma factor for flagellar operon FliA n=1 Tax=Duganella sacchari TaxID=551987 RepID=A0A1M7PL32_9BURK|nr:sigma-70 family RNA polymerase sigma factor [Duganella sacchari]SHN17848.1 RNA polymerase sigma factor for flagellar operon FliA [Duganella sacchari]